MPNQDKKGAPSKRTAILLATITAFLWGLSFLSIKTAVAVVPPTSLGLARFVIASVMMLVLFAVMRRRPRLALKDLPAMAWTGFLGITLYFIGENNGVLLLTASEASIIVGTIPVLTMIAERAVLRTKLSVLQYFGAAMSAAGVALIVIESLRLSPAPLGYAFMGLAALTWVAYAFFTKPLLVTYDSLEVTLWQSVFGAVGFIPFVLFESVDWAAVTPVVVANVVYLGVFCSAVGYLFYVVSLQVLGAGVSSVFINLIPVVSVAASFVLLGERLSPVQLAGGVVAVAGVYTATLSG
ncbi:MAG: DMT family transporter, partial [Spirochaetales bacterium]|nr:DMT family transporter [Spirochaetales bacterium]